MHFVVHVLNVENYNYNGHIYNGSGPNIIEQEANIPMYLKK